MRQKMVWRYWCEFCGKAGCGKGAMRKHETHCTMNPERECRMCIAGADGGGKVKHKPLAAVIELLVKTNDASQALDFSGCPACTLAALRQSGLNRTILDEAGNSVIREPLPFDYKKEAVEFWQRVNREAAAEDFYY